MLSIIVSVLNSHEVVRRQLIHFNSIMDDECELILLDDGSEPALKEIVDSVKKDYDFTLIETKDFRPWTQPKARNLGASISKYPILLFFDIDHILTREAIEVAKSIEKTTKFYRYAGSLDERGKLYLVDKEDISVHQNTFAIKKEVFMGIGGYDEKFCGQYGDDDADFFKRHGHDGEVEGHIYCMSHTVDAATTMFHDLPKLEKEKPDVMIYSALIGNRGHLHSPEIDSPHMMYTNRDLPDIHQGWKINLVKSRSGKNYDPRLITKIFKFDPYTYCKSKLRIWIDASIVLTEKFNELKFGHDLTFFRHYKRDCIYEEAEICKELGLDDPQIIDAQMERYEEAGFPKHFGLPEGGVIVSKDTPKVREFFKVWKEEVKNGSVRDQLSVSYALWKSGVDYEFLIDDKDGKRAMEYRKTYSHVAVEVKDKPLFVLMTPLHNPDPHWFLYHRTLMMHLSKRFFVQEVYGIDSSYLYKIYNSMWGAPKDADVNTKPFDGMPHLKDYKWAFVVENDMLILPEHIDKLLARDVDVISGVYMMADQKTYVHSDVMVEDDGSGNKVSRLPVSEGTKLPVGEDLIEKGAVGQGGLLLKHGVMEKIQYPWHAPMFIQELDEEGKVKRAIQTGQDIAIAMKIRQAGFKIWLDQTVRYTHRKVVGITAGDNEKKYNAVIEEAAAAIAKRAPVAAKKILAMRKAV